MSAFVDDELPGFEKATISLVPEDDGELVATLVRKKLPPGDTRPAVLYVHGFVDYFFQTHVADVFEEAGYRFYALDLRRYGRSLRPGNRANLAKSIDDYFEELDLALEAIGTQHPAVAAIVAHSTGGLVSSLYMSRGKQPVDIGCVVLNSPFLRMPLSGWNLTKSRFVARAARFMHNTTIPDELSGIYGMTLHRSQQGEWDYDLEKKPLKGFPLRAGWFRIIRNGHRQLEAGLDIDKPILCLRSSQSREPGKTPVAEDFESDLVLKVEHIEELSPRLGSQVTDIVIPGGLHDLTLSKKEAREMALKEMVSFVRAHSPT